MSRLVVVSNRVPLPDENGNPPPGGLAVAVHAALRKNGGIWMGWSGRSTGEEEPQGLTTLEQDKISYVLTDLSQADLDEYYNGFANRVLWPIFHCRLDLAEYARQEMAGYFRVNRLFADRLVPMLEPDDVIWVHDYHLIPLAQELRKRGVRNRIGFFLHIPWPPADIVTALPVYEIIMRGLAAYDLVGFQTDYDLDNFVGCLRREGWGDWSTPGWLRAFDKEVAAAAFPIGIETGDFARLAAKTDGLDLVTDMEQSLHGSALIIGVDRLDYSKGIAARIDAFERYLMRNPDQAGKVTLLQVAPHSRSDVPEYLEMQGQVESHCGRVNGAHGTIEWVPIRYVNQSLTRPVLAGLYRLAKVGLVTPLRDGMNLVAKEYVASQDPADPGVLVLSRFAGAARELDGAIFINPYDTEQTAGAIGRALSMPLDERIARWRRMMDHLESHDVLWWCRTFLAALNEAPEDNGALIRESD